MSIPGTPPTTISSVGQFVEYLEEHKSDSVLFRGQSEDLPLVPTVARLKPRETGLLDAERRMLEEFRRQAHPFLEREPGTDWDLLAIAQHHGMATRLLDWTLNPLAALWFAVKSSIHRAGPGVVWILDYHGLSPASADSDPFSCETVLILSPQHMERRIASQLAWFTVHPCDSDGRFSPLESLLESALTKVTIEREAFPALRRQLDRLGLNAASLYPGLDGLCQYLEWHYSLAPDEAPPASMGRTAS